LTTTPWTNSLPDTQKTEYDKRKMKNIHNELLVEMTPESQQLIKGAIKKGASSWLSALPSDWICTE